MTLIVAVTFALCVICFVCGTAIGHDVGIRCAIRTGWIRRNGEVYEVLHENRFAQLVHAEALLGLRKEPIHWLEDDNFNV